MTERSRFNLFIGVDLGGGKGKNTAVALLSRASQGVRVQYVGTKTPEHQPFHDAALLAFIHSAGADGVVAIDAPLMPTVCVRCRLDRCPGLEQCVDPVVGWFRSKADPELRAKSNARNGGGTKPLTTPYTQRACEVHMTQHYGIIPRETLGQGMGPLTARAHYLRRALETTHTLNENLLEVYPKATIQQLFGADIAQRYKRQVDTWRTRATILEKLNGSLQFEVWREGCLANDHCFDAVICAYTAFLWAEQQWELPTEDRDVFQRDGWIWFPP